MAKNLFLKYWFCVITHSNGVQVNNIILLILSMKKVSMMHDRSNAL